MRFLTLDAYHARDTPGVINAAALAYDRHLVTLRGVLPDHLLALAALPGVDDGLIVEVHHDRNTQALQLVLRCGGQPMGYYDLVLRYENIQLSPQTRWNLTRIARTTRNDSRHEHDIAYHEVDRTDSGGVEHRLLFHPGVVVNLPCDHLRWHQVGRPDRRLPWLPDRFPEGPSWAAYRMRRRRLRAEPSRR